MTSSARFAPGTLIAVPQLLDPNFFHAVVLLIEHTSEGAMGLTINHPTDQSIQNLYEQLGRPWPGDDQAFLMRGGPVQPEHAWIVHGPDCDAGTRHPIVDGIYLNTSLDALDQIVACGEDYRFFVGYAGWGPGQLDREVQEGAWILSNVDRALLFHTPLADIWETALRNMGIDPTMLVMGRGVH